MDCPFGELGVKTSTVSGSAGCYMSLPIDVTSVLDGILHFAFGLIAMAAAVAAYIAIARPMKRLGGPVWRRFYRYSSEWNEFDTIGQVQLMDGTMYDGLVMARRYRGQVQYRAMNAREFKQHSEELISKNAW